MCEWNQPVKAREKNNPLEEKRISLSGKRMLMEGLPVF